VASDVPELHRLRQVATALTRARKARLPSPWTGRGTLEGCEARFTQGVESESQVISICWEFLNTLLGVGAGRRYATAERGDLAPPFLAEYQHQHLLINLLLLRETVP